MRFAMILSLLAVPAAAQQGPNQISLPQGCTAYLTVQAADCSVNHHFTCEGDPAGHKRRVSFDERGLVYAGMIDNEGQWIISNHLTSQHTEELAPNPSDSQSLTELFSTDIDTWDFVTNSAEIGPTRYRGYDKLTGETVVIDGVTLERTEVEITATTGEGEEVWSGVIEEYVSRDLRMFFGGVSTITTSRGTNTLPDGSPVEFINPGEDGFLSPNPKHGCGLTLS